MKSRTFSTVLLASSIFMSVAKAESPKPVKILLLTGGCCHHYATQKELLKQGIEARMRAVVDQIHVDDSSTTPAFPIYGQDDYAADYDLVIHDECAADVRSEEIIEGVLKPHRDGIPAVVLHCAMHSYRQEGYDKPITDTSEKRAMWFELLGLQSSAHGPQEPIRVSFIQPPHPITDGLADWATGSEELYNNVAVFPTTTPLAMGKQGADEVVVAWINLYGEKKTRVFGTTLGHNDATVGDDRYLDLVTRGVLWAVGKLGKEGKPLADYEAQGKSKMVTPE